MPSIFSSGIDTGQPFTLMEVNKIVKILEGKDDPLSKLTVKTGHQHWIPGALGSTHVSIWAKLDVEDSYYMGSFGDTHYIGHIPADMYGKAGEEGLAETTQDQMMRDNMAQIVNMEDTNQLTL
ncbi:uncharacterized protein L203_105130 [Cryptococcus depauperatus CBS 7841]|uniref:CREG-like beta-barrel domain-containing protein n=1 Tax=Cryptococcus depauperatus CBS 7841 TaxID=1295531 RepID=A0AAJ8JWV0_9TREE